MIMTDKEFLLAVRDIILESGDHPYVVARLECMSDNLPVYSNVVSQRRGW